MSLPTTTSSLRAWRGPALAAGIGLLLAVSCRSPEAFKTAADDEVYPLVLRERSRMGQDGDFTIEPNEESLREDLLRGEAELTEPLDLLELLDIAALNSRDYQTRKESVYQAALEVTRQRWLLDGRGDLGVDASVSGSGSTSETASVTPSA